MIDIYLPWVLGDRWFFNPVLLLPDPRERSRIFGQRRSVHDSTDLWRRICVHGHHRLLHRLCSTQAWRHNCNLAVILDGLRGHHLRCLQLCCKIRSACASCFRSLGYQRIELELW